MRHNTTKKFRFLQLKRIYLRYRRDNSIKPFLRVHRKKDFVIETKLCYTGSSFELNRSIKCDQKIELLLRMLS